MKKSGLADSPFFQSPPPLPPTSVERSPITASESVPVYTDTQPHERTPTQPEERPRTRETYDIYEDQAQTVEELRLQWSKTRKKHITKGQVMRELLDEILPKHQ